MTWDQLHSMTGFGRGEAALAVAAISVEIRAVNHRGLDVRVRVPGGRGSLGLEDALRRRIAAVVRRGAVTVAVHVTPLTRLAPGSLPPGPQPTKPRAEAPLACDVTDQEIAAEVALAARYCAALRAEAARAGTAGPIPALDTVWAAVHAARTASGARSPALGADGDEELAWDDAERVTAVMTAADAALTALVATRRREGTALAADLEGLLAGLGRCLDQIEPLAAKAPQAAAAHFAGRMRQLGATDLTAALTADRVASEAAALAARMDIHEELQRAAAHVAAFTTAAQTPVSGRRLDFLAQELHRELTTMGAKSAGTEIVSAIVAAKAQLDRIREQVQNVE